MERKALTIEEHVRLGAKLTGIGEQMCEVRGLLSNRYGGHLGDSAQELYDAIYLLILDMKAQMLEEQPQLHSGAVTLAYEDDPLETVAHVLETIRE